MVYPHTVRYVNDVIEGRGSPKEIGHEEPYYSTKISIFSFFGGLVWLLYTKQAQYNEGCAKLNYLLPEV